MDEAERQDLAERIAAEQDRLEKARQAPLKRNKVIAGWLTAGVILLFALWILNLAAAGRAASG